LNIAKELQKGLQLHQAGKLPEAGEIYKKILEADPENVDALNLMGVLLQAGGQLDTAIVLLEQATKLAPDYAAPLVNLGNALQLAGKAGEAVEAFEKAMALEPAQPEAANNLASALNDLGRHEDAVRACQAALKLKPGFAEAYNNMGNAQAALGRPEEAEESYKKALEINPTQATALFNLGNALVDQDRTEDALEQYRKAVALDNANAEKHYNYANTALELDLYEQAAESFQNAIDIDEDYLDAHCNLGSALQSLGRLDEAIASYRHALKMAGAKHANENRGPGNADLHWNLALALLQNGEFEEGWAEYEWRWQNPAFTTPQKIVPEPLWDGGDLSGKTILLHAEQGLGDTLQFIRYAPLVAGKGARVVVECRAPLVRLLAGTPGVDQVVGQTPEQDRVQVAGDVFGQVAALPSFDCHAPLMSLPHLFGTTLDSIPAAVPYLAPPPNAVVDSRLFEGDGLKVGFAWAGSPTRTKDHTRSLEPIRFEPLFGVPGARFYSLQVGGGMGGFDKLQPAENVFDLGADFADFADTAAAVKALDLVICVDTAVAHLAGGLGIPAWVLLPAAGGYLWLHDRDDSPWYPGLRLFRQPAPGDWDSVLAAVGVELRKLA